MVLIPYEAESSKCSLGYGCAFSLDSLFAKHVALWESGFVSESQPEEVWEHFLTYGSITKVWRGQLGVTATWSWPRGAVTTRGHWGMRGGRGAWGPRGESCKGRPPWGLGLWDKATSKGLCREGNRRINILISLFSFFPNFLLTG